jgi:hypothetical protein
MKEDKARGISLPDTPHTEQRFAMTRWFTVLGVWVGSLALVLATARSGSAFYWQPWPKGPPPGHSLPPPNNEPPGNPPDGPPGNGPPNPPPILEPPGSVVPEPASALVALVGLGTVAASCFWTRYRR